MDSSHEMRLAMATETFVLRIY